LEVRSQAHGTGFRLARRRAGMREETRLLARFAR
jgi:hypothetical protein